MYTTKGLIDKLNSIDITFQFDDTYLILKELISSGVSIKEIDEKCHKLTAYKIIDKLLIGEENNIDNINAIKDYYYSLQINQNKCLVISDNHLGRLSSGENIKSAEIYKNEKGLYTAYNYAITHGITDIIHLGDIIEGQCDQNANRLPLFYQTVYLENVYPCPSSVKTYLLYGNHEYNSILHDKLDSKFYRYCRNMELIGLSKSYIYFCGYPIRLTHYAQSAVDMKNIDIDCNFELSGHSHSYYLYEDRRILKVPSLSSATQCLDDIGFIELKNEENEFVFKYIDQYGNELGNKEKTLSKKILNK